jgi:superfamily II DNA or RNA helicase
MTAQRDYDAYLTRLNSAKFQSLFENQKDVLEQYVTTYATHQDVAVELPTGSGKTLISLLIGGAWLEGGKKVAVLSANKTLARQMASEARELGIPLAYMEGRGVLTSGSRGTQRLSPQIGFEPTTLRLTAGPLPLSY